MNIGFQYCNVLSCSIECSLIKRKKMFIVINNDKRNNQDLRVTGKSMNYVPVSWRLVHKHRQNEHCDEPAEGSK